MSGLTRASVADILGPVDERTLADILAAGANLEDLREARAIVEGRSDITGQGERAISGPLAALLVILGHRGG